MGKGETWERWWQRWPAVAAVAPAAVVVMAVMNLFQQGAISPVREFNQRSVRECPSAPKVPLTTKDPRTHSCTMLLVQVRRYREPQCGPGCPQMTQSGHKKTTVVAVRTLWRAHGIQSTVRMHGVGPVDEAILQQRV